MALDYYPKMWFGTTAHSESIDAPLAGADVSPSGWGSDGVYLGGGGYVLGSTDSHRDYQFEWRGTSSREMAMKMQAFRDGVYSSEPSDFARLVYFQDPLTFQTNVLPKRWAAPGMVIPTGGSEAGRLSTKWGLNHSVSTPSNLVAQYGVPLSGVSINSNPITTASSITKPARNVLWIPFPGASEYFSTQWGFRSSNDRSTLLLSFIGSGTLATNRGPHFRMVYRDGSLGTATRISGWGATHTVHSLVSSSNPVAGVLVYFVGSNYQVFGGRAAFEHLKVRTSSPLRYAPVIEPWDWGLTETGASKTLTKWYPGMGNSGCKFIGNPSFVNNNAVNGGQISYAATLREVGDWLQ